MNNRVHQGHLARKRFGQNFLNDQFVIDSIVSAINPQKGQAIVEIGPGLAAFGVLQFVAASKQSRGDTQGMLYAVVDDLHRMPRVMRQLYRGQADRAAFAEALPRCTMPVCYNGDVTTPEELHALETQFPQLSGIMIGRGFIADLALLRRARGGAAATREELRGYLDDLYHGYTELFGSAGCAVSRMKAHWFYLIHRFAGSEKLEKQLRKAREPWEYEVLVNQIFTLPML